MPGPGLAFRYPSHIQPQAVSRFGQQARGERSSGLRVGSADTNSMKLPFYQRKRFLTGVLPKPEAWVRNVCASVRRPVQHSAASWPWTPTHGIPKTTAVCGLMSILFWFCVGQPPSRQLSGVVAALRHPPTFSLKPSVDLGNRPSRSRLRSVCRPRRWRYYSGNISKEYSKRARARAS